MNRGKRVASCPNLSSRVMKKPEQDVPPEILQKIQRQYERCSPRIMGHPVNIPELFSSVILRGGYKAVCERRQWTEIAAEISLPRACTNISVALRRIYQYYLSSLEFQKYPNLSEDFVAQNFVEFPTPDGDNSDIPFSTTAVERSLGIMQRSTTNQPISSNLDVPQDSLGRSLRSLSSIQDIRVGTALNKINGDFNDRVQSVEEFAGRSSTGFHATHALDVTDIVEDSELQLAELSLCSGLPNDVDMTLNALLALSFSTPPTSAIRLAHCRNLLNLVLSSVGVYDDGMGSFIICDTQWRAQDQLNFLRFWDNAIRDPSGRDFLRSDVFINAEYDQLDANSVINRELFSPLGEHCGSRLDVNTGGASEDLYQTSEASRVLLVATILANLVTPPSGNSGFSMGLYAHDDDDDQDDEFSCTAPFSRVLRPHEPPQPIWRENSRVLSRCPTAVRFAFLCAYADHSGLRHLGFQLLSSLRFPLDPSRSLTSLDCPLEWTPLSDNSCRLGDLTLSFLIRCLLYSTDRMTLIGGLNILSNLAKLPERENEMVLLDGLPNLVWVRLAQLICLPDLALVCSSLEALRCLTNLGAAACRCSWHACTEANSAGGSNALPLNLLQPLLALLTLEGQAMGSQSLHRIRLMQRNRQPEQLQNISRLAPGVKPNRYTHNKDFIQISPGHLPRTPTYVSDLKPSMLQTEPIFRPFVRNTTNVRWVPPIQPLHLSTVNAPIANPSVRLSDYPNGPHFPGRASKSFNINSNCSGLINLLTSTPTTEALIIVSSAPSTITTITSPASISVSSTSCLSTTSCDVKPLTPISNSSSSSTSPSLSELTDRLQMPPPSLPPPSALRRSSKLSQMRSNGGSSVLSPVSCKPRRSPPSNPPPNHINTPSSTFHDALSDSPTANDSGDNGPRLDTGADLITKDISGSRVSTAQVAITNGASPLQSCPNGRDISSENLKVGEKHSDDVILSADSDSSKVEVNDTKSSVKLETHDGHDHRFSVLSNGLPSLNSDVDKVEAKAESPFSHHSGRTNGLKPGILREAVDVLRGQQLENLPPDRSSLLSKREHLELDGINGLMDDEKSSVTKSERVVGSPTKCIDADKLSHVPNSVHMNGLKLEDFPFSRSTVGECFESPEKKRVKQNDSLSSDSDDSFTNDEDDDDSSGESRDESPKDDLREALPRYPYRLKRRRRWGSRSRLFTIKRRRERTPTGPIHHASIRVTSTRNFTQNTVLPKVDAGPGSVLAPTWQPSSPEIDASMACSTNSIASLSSALDAISAVKPPLQCAVSTANCVTDTEQPQLPVSSMNFPHEPPSFTPSSSTTDTIEEPQPEPKYLCEWETCTCSFELKSEVFSHVFENHLQQQQQQSSSKPPDKLLQLMIDQRHPSRRCCRWRGCPSASLARARFSLMTHVLDWHCSSLELEARRRIAFPLYNPNLSISSDNKQREHQSSDVPSSGPELYTLRSSTLPVMDTPSGTIDPSAMSILHSIASRRRHIDLWGAHHHFVSANPHFRYNIPLPPLNPAFQVAPPPREGPVTKHLRVTAALILRNFVKHLDQARHWFLTQDSLITQLAMAYSPNGDDAALRTNDAFQVITQCLAICATHSRPKPVQSFFTSRRADVIVPCQTSLSLTTPRTQLPSNTRSSVSSLSTHPPNYDVDLDAAES